MTSLKPYLIRAVYEWIVDNDLTPYLMVSAEHNQGFLPSAFINDGKIILNIRPQAVEALSLGDATIEFNARFSGKSEHIIVSVNAVTAICAKEDGSKGLFFEPEAPEQQTVSAEKPASGKPTLTVVK